MTKASDFDAWAQLEDITPLHARVERFLRDGIESDRFPAHRPLPSARVLAEQLGVSRTTIQTAIHSLVESGVVVARARSGVYPTQVSRAVSSAEEIKSNSEINWQERLVRSAPDSPSIVPTGIGEIPFPFVTGQIESRTFPSRAWLKAMSAAMSGPHMERALHDAQEYDDPLLVEAIKNEVLGPRGINASNEEIMVTYGTQQGLSLISHALVGAGTEVVVEQPGYVDAARIFESAGAKLRFVGIDIEGALLPVGADLRSPSPSHVGSASFPRTSSLSSTSRTAPAAALQASLAPHTSGATPDPEIAYVTPSSQHPTTVTMSPARRASWMAWARRHGVVVIEDDYDAAIRLDGPPPIPLKALDTDGRVIYLGTFSKYLAPGLRMGFVVAPPELIAELRRLRHFSTKATSSLLQRSLGLFIDSGDYARQMRSYRVRLRAKWDAVREAADSFLPWGADDIARAQHALWLRAPAGVDTSRVARLAARRGVLVSPSELYFRPSIDSFGGSSGDYSGGVEAVNSQIATPVSGAVRGGLRVGLASIPQVRISAGIEALGAAMDS